MSSVYSKTESYKYLQLQGEVGVFKRRIRYEASADI